ncbi:hypothetical protein B484DRAFT_77980 [Ochromonadaceae sp. CCMP2298]|nr:hypothetical protein B484DRAFT_77980 [Ochromonadaceae sp. CCMP2298]
MSTLASQGKLTDLANKFDGKTPVRVHFLDNSSKVFLSGRDTLIKDIVLQCLTKVGVTDPSSSLPYFCLCESRNGSSIDGALDMEQGVGEVLQGWTEAQAATAKFLFMIRLYMPCIWGLQVSIKPLYLQLTCILNPLRPFNPIISLLT